MAGSAFGVATTVRGVDGECVPERSGLVLEASPHARDDDGDVGVAGVDAGQLAGVDAGAVLVEGEVALTEMAEAAGGLGLAVGL